jgi:hypothetical protein
MLALMRFESSEFKKVVKKLQRLGRDLGSNKVLDKDVQESSSGRYL